MRAVLVEFRVTEEGTLIFPLGPGEQKVSDEQVVCLPELTAEVVQDMLVRLKDRDRRRLPLGQFLEDLLPSPQN